MLLTDRLHTELLEPDLAALVGDVAGQEGDGLLAVAHELGHARSELRDWLYLLLLHAPNSLANRRLVHAPGKRAESLVDLLEQIPAPDTTKAPPPLAVSAATSAPEVAGMLADAWGLAQEDGAEQVSELLLTIALLDTLDPDLAEALDLWLGEGSLAEWRAELAQRRHPPQAQEPLLDEAGAVNPKAFLPTGQRLLRRLLEDAGSLGTQRITARHLLYSLLGEEQAPLASALAYLDPKLPTEMHQLLARELARPNVRRDSQPGLDANSLFASVMAVFSDAHAAATANARAGITERDVHLAFVQRHPRELARLWTRPGSFDLPRLTERIADMEPRPEVDDAEAANRLPMPEIEARLRQTILGQDSAIEQILPWLRRLRFGYPRSNRPAGVFLFLGPTGVGKTQLAKELARFVFGDPDLLIFLDMGQLHGKEGINTLLGAPPGYVGYGEGQLTNGLRDTPACVVLFDEIDKADPQVFNATLRLIDEGLVADPAGPVRDGRRCIVVLTTNAGQAWLRAHLAEHPEAGEDVETLRRQLEEQAIAELFERGFKPEFLGRIDEKVTFLPLSLATCRAIVDRDLDAEIQRFENHSGVTVTVDPPVRAWLADAVFSRRFAEGARSSPREVNRHVLANVIARLTEPSNAMSPPSRCLVTVDGHGTVTTEVTR